MEQKVCKACGQTKDVSDFYKMNYQLKNPRPEGYYSTNCKECRRKEKHQPHIRLADKKRGLKKRERNRNYVLEYLKSHPCVDCGESNPILLDFDHDNPNEKRSEISKMIRSCISTSTIQTEIDKCTVRCANCHRIRTSKQLGWWKAV